MKNRDRWKWAAMAIIAAFLVYLGKINYHQRFSAQFVLIILAAMAVLIFAFYLFSYKT